MPERNRFFARSDDADRVRFYSEEMAKAMADALSAAREATRVTYRAVPWNAGSRAVAAIADQRE